VGWNGGGRARLFQRKVPAPIPSAGRRYGKPSHPSKIFTYSAAPPKQFSCNNACADHFGWTNLYQACV